MPGFYTFLLLLLLLFCIFLYLLCELSLHKSVCIECEEIKKAVYHEIHIFTKIQAFSSKLNQCLVIWWVYTIKYFKMTFHRIHRKANILYSQFFLQLEKTNTLCAVLINRGRCSIQQPQVMLSLVFRFKRC